MRAAWRFTPSEYSVELCVDAVTCQGEILILKAKSMLKPESVCWRMMIEGWRLMLFHLQEDWNCLAIAITLKTKDHQWREILLLLCVLYTTLICSTTTGLKIAWLKALWRLTAQSYDLLWPATPFCYVALKLLLSAVFGQRLVNLLVGGGVL